MKNPKLSQHCDDLYEIVKELADIEAEAVPAGKLSRIVRNLTRSAADLIEQIDKPED